MRKLKLQMQVSLDGFASTGPNDEQKWVTWAWEEIKADVLGLLHSSDTILIGRKLAVDYIPYWSSVTNPEDPMIEAAAGINSAKKVVFSTTLETSHPLTAGWTNTVIANDNITLEIKKLKEQTGKDLIVYGGTSFVSALIKEKLIDEFNFFVNPVALGKGDAVFTQLQNYQALSLKNTKRYNCGIVLLSYEI